MAQIRLVDDWLRSPASYPTHYRSVMVIAEKWAEQRVLMRAYAQSREQTMPTILLHGVELAIGPAGIDVNGPWGIHVGEGPEGVEARAQAVKLGLEDAARRLAGSKGNPPRLADEESTFEREPTGNWAPGTPRVLPNQTQRGGFNPSPSFSSGSVGSVPAPPLGSAPGTGPSPFGPSATTLAPGQPMVDFVVAPTASRMPQNQPAAFIPQIQSAQQLATGTAPQAGAVTAPSNPEMRLTPLPRRHSAKTKPPPTGGRTALGYSSGSGAQSAIVRLGLAPHVSAHLGRLADRVVPAEFHIDGTERAVLNALGETDHVTARAIGQLLGLDDAVTFMEELLRKLEKFGLADLVEPGDPSGGEPTYKMRR
ncbi:MAG: hypothetical protein ABJE66_06115 [Deltaproteobacteria bacterium]